MEAIYSCFKSASLQFKNKTMLITGSTGMLPSYIVLYFIYLHIYKKIPLRIIAIARNENKARKLFGHYTCMDFFDLVLANVNDPISVSGKVDFIIHGASLASPQYYKYKPVDTMLPNIFGTYNLLEMAKRNKLDAFLYFSSGSIYGGLPENSIVNENYGGWIDPLAVNSCYAESKRMGETMCVAFYRQYGVPV